MRATMNICGVSSVKGEDANTGNAYNYKRVSATFPDMRKIEDGVRAVTFNVYPSVADLSQLLVGASVEVVYHEYQGRIIVDAVL